tara:strand:- start:87940 stop:88590 length:651 start_codon:yes stop_codon:yes gene_type:complete
VKSIKNMAYDINPIDEDSIAEGMRYLAAVDVDVANALVAYGPPSPRLRPEGFETFLSIIVSQQLSTNVARAIMGRVVDLLPEVSADALMLTEDIALREAGLSYRKIEYAKSLAAAIQSGHFDVNGLKTMSNEEAIKEITALRGFGRWSAEIYLMISLQRKDIFPADDLALLVSLGRLKQLKDKPTPKQARDLTAHWAPWRSIGSLFLWHFYHGAPT